MKIMTWCIFIILIEEERVYPEWLEEIKIKDNEYKIKENNMNVFIQ